VLAGSAGGGGVVVDAVAADALMGAEDALLGDAVADAAAGLGDAVAGVGDSTMVAVAAAGDAGLGILSLLPTWLVSGGLVALLGELVFAAIALFALLQAGASKGKDIVESSLTGTSRTEEPEVSSSSSQLLSVQEETDEEDEETYHVAPETRNYLDSL